MYVCGDMDPLSESTPGPGEQQRSRDNDTHQMKSTGIGEKACRAMPFPHQIARQDVISELDERDG